ncbi:MAG: phosphatidate cytidylyltransferase [Ignavibacteria bacterium]|nr:phosphatidate cytidylyltransferase [Ignavibacteria bacterium]
MSNIVKRVLIGVIGIPIILFLIFKGGLYFFVFTLIVQSVCLFEFNKMFEKRKYYPLKIFAMLCSLIFLCVSYFLESYITLCVLSIIILTVSVEVFRKGKRNPVNPVISIFSMLYITVPFILLNELLLINNFNIVFYVVVLIWSCDTFAYFGGKYFGKHLLSSISPKKTWEGSVIGFIFTNIASLIFHFYFPEVLTLEDALIVGSAVGIFGQIGDLFESMLKRYNEVKDSSNIIPGHGGVLDRFDSLIFVSPIVFVYFNYLK